MENKANVYGSDNVLIQGVNGSTVTVHTNNAAELKQLIESLGSDVKEIPQNFLKLIESMPSKEEVLKGDAKIYLTVLLLTSGYGYGLRGAQLKFSVTVTNLHKEHRYFVNTYFVVTPKLSLDGGVEHDTFSMVPDGNNIFPFRLEYGQPITLNFAIKEAGLDMYRALLEKDNNATIKAYAVTSLGEVYESNDFGIGKLVEYFEMIQRS